MSRRDDPKASLDVGDPRAKFPHAANGPVLAYLAAGARPAAQPSVAHYDMDEYVARTHPDLADALAALGRELSVPRRAAYGVAVLATKGVVFAVASGTSSLGFRLEDREWPLAIEMGAVPWPELGPDWMRFDGWDADVPARQHVGDLRYFTESAHRHARALTPGPGR